MPVQDLRDRLATATALLEPIRAEIQTCEAEALQRDPEDETHIQADGYRHIRAMLSTTPAPSERAAAERAVLDASAALHASDLDWMHGLSMGRRTTIRDVAAAELARRAVSK